VSNVGIAEAVDYDCVVRVDDRAISFTASESELDDIKRRVMGGYPITINDVWDTFIIPGGNVGYFKYRPRKSE
jgi:hypothetical protein